MTAALDIPRLRPDAAALLVVDVQERLMPTIAAAARVEANCALLARAAGVLGMPVLCTEQYVKGLGHTAPAVHGALPAGATVVEKTRFSAAEPAVLRALEAAGRRSVLVCGVEAHVCVLQTVLDLRAAGHRVFHATDAISSGQADQVPHAFRRMELAGAVPTGTLGAMYELVGDAADPRFREILALAKQVVRDA